MSTFLRFSRIIFISLLCFFPSELKMWVEFNDRHVFGADNCSFFIFKSPDEILLKFKILERMTGSLDEDDDDEQSFSSEMITSYDYNCTSVILTLSFVHDFICHFTPHESHSTRQCQMTVFFVFFARMSRMKLKCVLLATEIFFHKAMCARLKSILLQYKLVKWDHPKWFMSTFLSPSLGEKSSRDDVDKESFNLAESKFCGSK